MSIRHYSSIEDKYKEPNGPYRQAPEEYGGEWWYMSPFGSLKPWLHQDSSIKKVEYPNGFVFLFGEKPLWKDFIGMGQGAYRRYQGIVGIWERDLRDFKGLGLPEWITSDQIIATNEVLLRWKIGLPEYYESRYGYLGRLIHSEIPDYDSSTYHIINFPHHLVAQVQIEMFHRGIDVEKWHPFVPPGVVAVKPSEG